MAALDWSQCLAVESTPRQGQRRVGVQGHPSARRHGFAVRPTRRLQVVEEMTSCAGGPEQRQLEPTDQLAAPARLPKAGRLRLELPRVVYAWVIQVQQLSGA